LGLSQFPIPAKRRYTLPALLLLGNQVPPLRPSLLSTLIHAPSLPQSALVDKMGFRYRSPLTAALRFLAGVVANKEQTAIRAIQQLPADVASLVCDSLGINFREYRQYLNSYRSECDLLSVIEKAQVDDTPLLRFVRAALSVIYGTNISGPRRRESIAPMDPVTAAKYLTGTLKPVGEDF